MAHSSFFHSYNRLLGYFHHISGIMKKRIPYREWRDGLLKLVPEKDRIGTDLLFIEKAEGFLPASDGPLIFDVTSAIFLLEGYTEISINMKQYHVQAPAIMIIMPDTVMQYVSASNDNKSFSVIMSSKFFMNIMNDSALQSSLHTQLHKEPVISLPQSDARVLLQYKDLLNNLLHSPIREYKMEAIRHLTLTLFYGYIVSRQIPGIPKTSSRADEIFKEFIALLQEDYSAHRDVSYYADKLYITPKYLSTAVKKASGKSPSDWINEYVAIAAKAMLSSSAQSIDEISLRLNFDSLSLFGKFFKRVTGLSPRAYRNNL